MHTEREKTPQSPQRRKKGAEKNVKSKDAERIKKNQRETDRQKGKQEKKGQTVRRRLFLKQRK